MQFSNVLMVIAVVAVALAVFNLASTIVVQETAFATSDPGNVSLVAAASVSINFTTDSIAWGTGAVNSVASPQSAVLNSEGVITRAAAGAGNWTQVTSGLVLKNDGNVHVNLTLVSDKTAATFIGGTSVTPRYDWKLDNIGVPAACSTGTVALNPTGAYVAVTTGAVARNVCGNFTVGSNLRVNVEVEIPLNSPPEPKSSIITAQAYYPSN